MVTELPFARSPMIAPHHCSLRREGHDSPKAITPKSHGTAIAAPSPHPYDAPLFARACLHRTRFAGTNIPMLNSLSKLTSKGPTKIVTAVLMFLLSGSFALWGIEDVFRGHVSTDVATVGNVPITYQAYMEAYRQRTNAITRATGKPITPDLARTFGLDKQVLNALIGDAALDSQAKKYGLGLDSQKMLQAVVNDPNFKVSLVPGQPPVFDPNTFRQL